MSKSPETRPRGRPNRVDGKLSEKDPVDGAANPNNPQRFSKSSGLKKRAELLGIKRGIDRSGLPKGFTKIKKRAHSEGGTQRPEKPGSKARAHAIQKQFREAARLRIAGIRNEYTAKRRRNFEGDK